MRALLSGLVLCLALNAGTAHAVDLKDCNAVRRTSEKIKCLQANLVLLNSAFQTVAGELRTAVGALKQDVSMLKTDVGTLKSDVATLKTDVADLKNNKPDLSKYVRYGTNIQLESKVHFGTCLDHDTHDPGHIQGWGCNPGQAWQVNQR